MKPKLTTLATALLAFASSSPAAEFKFGTQTFTLPDGFTMERVAGPGLVDRPVEADFDDQGRLYVTDSSGSNEPVTKQLEKKPHRIVRLEDTDGDGIFDHSVVFADKMMFPEGAMWFDGSLYVSAPPVIWKLTDTDGDGVADKREEWYDPKTLTGCANDLHGPYLGLDGWIYWSKGAFAKQNFVRPDGRKEETRAAHIFRRRPEGGGIEPVMTGGMDNPVGVAFTPEGERIFTTTFFQHPGGGQRDGLVHAIYGGVYGKVHDVIDDHAKTGELMPVLTHLGPAAPCGIARYESAGFGPAYQDNLFACLFNLHKVTRHVLKPSGGSYKTEDSDFLTCDSPDFHPTDVLEDADGSLIVVDTGGWYKICCPTSQLWKPDVLGAVYRIRKAGAQPVNDPRGAKLEWTTAPTEDLAGRLADSRPAVVKRSILALRRTDSAAALKTTLSTESLRARQNAIWALTSSKDPHAIEAIESALASDNGHLVHTAIQALSVSGDKDVVPALLMLLENADPGVRRAAAEAIGRLGDARAVKVLLSVAGKLTSLPNSPLSERESHGLKWSVPDRVLEHSIIYALIEINSPGETRAGLKAKNPLAQRVALIALDQMRSGNLKPDDVLPLLQAEGLLNQTANWIVSHRNQWGAALASHFESELMGLKDASAVRKAELEVQLQQLAGAPAIEALLESMTDGDSAPREARLIALATLKRSRPKNLTDSRFLLTALRSADAELVQAGAEAAGAIGFEEAADTALKKELSKVAKNQQLPPETRLEAVNARATGATLDKETFELVRNNLSSEAPLNLRSTATAILSKSRLSEEQVIALGDNLKSSGPLEITRLVDLYDKFSSAVAGDALVSGLKDARGLAGVHPDRLKQVLAKYPETVRDAAKPILKTMNEDAEKQALYIDELLPKLQGGDIRRGQAIFNSTRAACSSCHAIGYLGGNVGPDLTRIGQIRTERDLLEAIVYPSASFVRSFEPFIVATRSGDDYSGIIRKDSPEEIVLVTGPAAEMHIARADVAEVRPGKVSVMPQGLNEQLTHGELADLLAFLKATRW